MRIRAWHITLVSALTLTMSACSSGANPQDVHATPTTFTDPSSPTTASPAQEVSTQPAPGAITSKDKVFTYVVPNGWNASNNPKAVAYLSSATFADDVAPSIAVTKSSVSPAPALDEVVQLAEMNARSDGASVSTMPTRKIGGEAASAFRASLSYKNVDIQRIYTVVAHEGQLYTVVLTAAAKDPKAAESALNDFLGSWTWTVPGKASSTATGTTPAAVPTTTSTSTTPSPSSSSTSSAASSSPSSGTPTASSTASASTPAPKKTAPSSGPTDSPTTTPKK